MYYYIKGTLARLEPTFAVIDCAGVGYRLAVSASTHASLAPLLGRDALLYTYLAVREDALELYGFFDETEKRVFTYLISVSGVGPKGAMSVLSVMSASRLASFVAAGDARAIASAPGVGLKTAQKIIIELNEHIPAAIRGLHDIYVPADPPYRREIPIYKPSDRIGSTVLKVDPKKIIGVVHSSSSDHVHGFAPIDETTMRIGENVCKFLAGELRAGRIPKGFLPLQSGVGNIANAVLHGLETSTEIPQFEMYTEVIQDAVIDLMEKGKCRFASTCALTFSDETMDRFFGNIGFFRDKVLIRPGEISNNPEIIRRLGLITMNTALEADIFGNVNSTHVTGTKMMNGIGGSGDFTRNAYISIFSCPSITKEGKISTIVPMVSHLDHSEHSVAVLITDQGIADLRGKDPEEKAHLIIENCAHPAYRQLLRDYLKLSKGGHTPHCLRAAFGFHEEFMKSGDMSKTDWSAYC